MDAKRFEDEPAKLASWQKGSRSLCMDGGTRKADYPEHQRQGFGTGGLNFSRPGAGCRMQFLSNDMPSEYARN